MTEWCMAHPWMTFFILMTFAVALCNIGPLVIVQKVNAPTGKKGEE